MKILVLNPIMFTAENNVIPKVKSIKDTLFYNICLALNKQGHDVTLAAAKDFHPSEDEVYDFDVKWFKTVFHKVFPPSVLPYSLELKQYVRKHASEFDLVISSEVFQFTTLFAAEVIPEKTLVWQEGAAHQRKMHQIPSTFWHNIVDRLFLRKVSVVVPRSIPAYRFIKQYMPMTVESVVDHGINLDKFSYSTEKKRQIISSSRLIKRKNIDGIIRIFAELHKMAGYDDIRLLIAGRGDEEIALKKLSSELCLDGVVEFLGFLPHVTLNKYIRESMAFIINTDPEMNVVSIPESIVSGTPVLSNKNNTSSNFIVSKKVGIVKETLSVEDLKDLIDNYQIYVGNCLAIRDTMSSDYTAKRLVEIFQEHNINKK
jgi:1,2-diacylglycerol 3-alpha-glucosyltransferase